MNQMFHIETENNFFTVAATSQVEAVSFVAIRERVRKPFISFCKAIEGCFTSKLGILGQEAL